MPSTDRIELTELVVRTPQRELVHGVTLEIKAGELVALVGASGCGKTLTARSLLGMVEGSPWVEAGQLAVHIGEAVHRPYSDRKNPRGPLYGFNGIRGDLIGYLPQQAREALDPLLSVGTQVAIAAKLAKHGETEPLPWLQRAGFPGPERVARLYPHELSGGMAQRVVIAQSLARGSRFLLADEPTTGLDPTVQAEILVELAHLRDAGIGLLLITHDLRILPDLADRILLMDGGRIVEEVGPEALRAGTLTSEPGKKLIEATKRVAAGRLG